MLFPASDMVFLGKAISGRQGTAPVVYAAIGLGIFNLLFAALVHLVLKSGWKIKD